MIGQDIGTEYLPPKALDPLEENPLVEGDFYEGDLLKFVIDIPKNYWGGSPKLLQRILRIAANAVNTLKAKPVEDLYALDRRLMRELEEFCGRWKE